MKANLKALCKGFVRAFSGSAVFGMIGVAIWWLSFIPQQTGYEAVISCAGAATMMTLGITSMFKLGGGKTASGKFAK